MQLNASEILGATELAGAKVNPRGLAVATMARSMHTIPGGGVAAAAITAVADTAIQNRRPAATFGPVSCGAAGSCAAVGFDESLEEVDYGFIATLADGTWTSGAAPLPADAAHSQPDSKFDDFAVACPAAGACVAVSDYSTPSFGTYGVIETLSGGTWTPMRGRGIHRRHRRARRPRRDAVSVCLVGELGGAAE